MIATLLNINKCMTQFNKMSKILLPRGNVSIISVMNDIFHNFTKIWMWWIYYNENMSFYFPFHCSLLYTWHWDETWLRTFWNYDNFIWFFSKVRCYEYNCLVGNGFRIFCVMYFSVSVESVVVKKIFLNVIDKKFRGFYCNKWTCRRFRFTANISIVYWPIY